MGGGWCGAFEDDLDSDSSALNGGGDTAVTGGGYGDTGGGYGDTGGGYGDTGGGYGDGYCFLFGLPGRFKFPVGSEGWSGWPESDPRFEDDSPRPLFFFSHLPPPGGSLRLSIDVDGPGVLFEDDPGGFEDDSLGPSLFFFLLPPRYRPFGRSSRVKGLSVNGPGVVPEG